MKPTGQFLRAHPHLGLFPQCPVAQLVDSVKLSELQKLRSNLTGIKIVQVIHVTDDSCVEKALAVSSLVDAILLDSGNQNLEVKELGGKS